MTPLFDIEKIRRNRAYALDHMDGHDFLYQKAAEAMIDNVRDIKRDFQNILIIGTCSEKFIKHYFFNENITIFDIDNNLNEIPGYSEGAFDCILCMHYLHVVNDVPSFLLRVKSMLKPDGVFLCSFFGGRSLQELRAVVMEAELEAVDGVTQQIHPMIDHYQMAGLLQQTGFALPVVDYDRVVVHYQNLETLFEDLRCMGESNALINRKSNIKNLKQDIENIYKNKFYNDGYIATFDIVHGIGWAPHESQQKPAARGSGDISLTEILQ